MCLRITLIVASLVSSTAFGQTYAISTVAGGGPQFNVLGTSTSLGGVVSVATDPAGNLFFSAQSIVMRLDAITGVLTLVAGNGTEGFSGDNGPATGAQVYRPNGVAVDSTGNLYFADVDNNRIRKVSGGVITTVAGNGTEGFGGDNGPATNAQLSAPGGVAVDSTGNLYICDNGNNRIRKVSNGIITTVAGNGTAGFSGDNGSATNAELKYPNGVAVDSAANFYISDYGNGRIRKVSGGVITTIAGGGSSFGDNGPATDAQLDGPSGVAVDFSGDIYIADTYDNRIRMVSDGMITTLAGNGTAGSSGDNGPATSASLSYPLGVAVDSAGNAYIADYADSRVRKVTGGVITTVAGNAADGFSGDIGLATSAELTQPAGVAVDSAGNLYIGDYFNDRVRKVSNGLITTVAGSATYGFSGDRGPATSAELTGPVGVAVDSAGNLYIADSGNNRIRKVSNGVINTVAGDGTPGFSGDNGPATSAELTGPVGVAVDSAGNLYIADSNNNRIRKVSNGVITTVAGNGTFGFRGDNGPATSAELSRPTGVAVDSAGDLYIADASNERIREVSNGLINTVAGNGTDGLSGDNGPATSAEFDVPSAVAVNSAGSIYIADQLNNRIRLLSPSFSSSAITSVSTASGGANIAQNTFIVIKGVNLVPETTPAVGVIWSNAPSFASGQMPTQLGGVSVTINGKPAYIYFFCSAATSQVCTSDQINVLTPLDSTTGLVPIVVASTTSSGTTESSPYEANLAAVAPTLLAFGSTSYVAATHANSGLVGPTSLYPGSSTPAQPGEQVAVYSVGFGLPTTPLASGSSTQSGVLPSLPVCVVGTNVATVTYSGLISPGLYQLNIVIPDGTPNGDQSIGCRYDGTVTPGGILITVSQ